LATALVMNQWISAQHIIDANAAAGPERQNEAARLGGCRVGSVCRVASHAPSGAAGLDPRATIAERPRRV
ncbi:hypothetical protein, partial [Methylobacterium sp. WL116]|uniref:hypothetical protein n=1 Tax=Methylobacterium sp. WL116 TaxID=2603889 RepID=UPI001AEECA1C